MMMSPTSSCSHIMMGIFYSFLLLGGLHEKSIVNAELFAGSKVTTGPVRDETLVDINIQGGKSDRELPDKVEVEVDESSVLPATSESGATIDRVLDEKNELIHPGQAGAEPRHHISSTLYKCAPDFLDDRQYNLQHCCERFNSCCDGEVPGSNMNPTFWSHIQSFAENYHVREILDSTPRMLERHYTFWRLMQRNTGAWNRIMRGEGSLYDPETSEGSWFLDCFFGSITILLNALPATEWENGIQAAQVHLDTVLALLESNDNLNFMTAANFTINPDPIMPRMAPWKLLLEMADFSDADPTKTDVKECFGTGLKIYVHNTGRFSQGALFCSAGQWGVEVLLHKWLMGSSCRELNPDKADFFYVPDYRACHYHLTPQFNQKGLTTDEGSAYSTVIHDHKSKTRDYEDADKNFKELLAHLGPHFAERQGMDHIFAFSDQGFLVNFTDIFPSWKEYIPNSIFLTTEAYTPGCGHGCFSPWKDIVIPGHLDLERMDMMRSFNLPSEKRTFLFNFHGRMGANHEYYKGDTTRNKLFKLFGPQRNFPDVSVGDFTEDYFEIMGKSHFCLIPEGTSSWTNHLYEAFFSGCIPFILSDHFVLPFPSTINWKRISVRWPQAMVGEEIYHYTKSFVEKHPLQLKKLKAEIDKLQCVWDFYRVDTPECSPYRALVTELKKRKDNFPTYESPFSWLEKFPDDPMEAGDAKNEEL